MILELVESGIKRKLPVWRDAIMKIVMGPIGYVKNEVKDRKDVELGGASVPEWVDCLIEL